MKLALIVKESWKDLPTRVDALEKKLSSMLPVKAGITVVLKDYGAIQSDKNGRILPSWFKKVAKLDGYDGACVLVSLSDRKRFKLKETLRGHYIRDEDGFIDFWVASDRLTKRKGKPQLEETFSHELLHGLYHWTGAKDRTHELHDANRLDEAFAEVSAAWPKPKKAAAPNPVTQTLPGVDNRLAGFALRLMSAMAELGKPVFVYEGFRSNERQAELYAQGRTKPGKIVTHAKPGESLHNSGHAIDIIFEKTLWSNPPADWALLGMMGKSLAFALKIPVTWGGDWKGALVDLPHWEIA